MEKYTYIGEDYILVGKIESFLYLINTKNHKDMKIRKQDPNDPDLLLPLSNEEYIKAKKLFQKYYSKLGEKYA